MNTRFIDLPKVNSAKNVYEWDGIIVKETKDKGLGVFIDKKCIKTDLMIPMGGRKTFFSDSIYKNSGRGRANYVATADIDSDDNACSIIDGHPIEYLWTIQHAWIGQLVNEPSLGETVNAVILEYDSSDGLIIPQYPNIDCSGEKIVVIKLTEDIEPGKEILVDYKYDRKTCGHYHNALYSPRFHHRR